MEKAKDLLFSIKRDRFRLEYFRAGGKGGQKQNKTSSACRITHIDSGAVGESRTHRTQSQNRKEALRRLADSLKFKRWLKMECAARAEGYADLQKKVDAMMADEFLQIETYDPGE